jgi:hypothetical protein
MEHSPCTGLTSVNQCLDKMVVKKHVKGRVMLSSRPTLFMSKKLILWESTLHSAAQSTQCTDQVLHEETDREIGR